MKLRNPSDDNLAWGANLDDAVSEHVRAHHEKTQTGVEKSSPDAYGSLRLPTRYCVYVLRCNMPGTKSEFVEQTQMSTEWLTDDIPSWAWAAWYSSQCVYVGFTHNPYLRVEQHVEYIEDPDEDGALFTKLFPPEKVESIDWYESETEARRMEVETAERIERERYNAFVYQQ